MTPASSAVDRIARKGGARRTEATRSTRTGRRLSGEMLNSPARTAWAWAGSSGTVAGGAVRPMRAKRRSAPPMATPEVQTIAPMCWLVVTPPTSDGTSTVVSEMGDILSPK